MGTSEQSGRDSAVRTGYLDRLIAQNAAALKTSPNDPELRAERRRLQEQKLLYQPRTGSTRSSETPPVKQTSPSTTAYMGTTADTTQRAGRIAPGLMNAGPDSWRPVLDAFKTEQKATDTALFKALSTGGVQRPTQYIPDAKTRLAQGIRLPAVPPALSAAQNTASTPTISETNAPTTNEESLFEKIVRYSSGNTDTTLPLALINTNPETQRAAEYLAGRSISGAIDVARGAANYVGYLGQEYAKGAYATAAAQNKMDDALSAGLTGEDTEHWAPSNFTLNREKIAKEQSDKPLETYVDWGRDYKKGLSQYGYDNDKGMQDLGKIAEGLGGMAPAIVSNYILPGSSLFIVATGAAGNATNEALLNGADAETALAYGTVIGLSEAATEKIFDGLGGIFGKGWTDDWLKSAISNYAKDPSVQKAVLSLADMLGEGFEEWLAEYAEAYANKLIINQDTRSFKEISSDAIYSAAIGSFISMVMQGTGVASKSGKTAGEMAADETIATVSGASSQIEQNTESQSENTSASPQTSQEQAVISASQNTDAKKAEASNPTPAQSVLTQAPETGESGALSNAVPQGDLTIGASTFARSGNPIFQALQNRQQEIQQARESWRAALFSRQPTAQQNAAASAEVSGTLPGGTQATPRNALLQVLRNGAPPDSTVSDPVVDSPALIVDGKSPPGYTEGATEGVGDVGQYTQKIKWGIQDVEVRLAGKGFFGQRIQQINPRVDAYELKINPNNESYYLKSPTGGYVQYENMVNDVVMDGKLVIQQKSFYHVNDLPDFARNKVLQEAMRQVEAANNVGYTVEWLISDPKAVAQLTDFFKSKNINIVVKYFPE